MQQQHQQLPQHEVHNFGYRNYMNYLSELGTRPI